VAESFVSAAREAILATVRSATAGSSPAAPVRRAYRRDGERTANDRIDLLSDRLVDYRATVRHLGVPELRDALEELAPGRIGVPPGLPQAWRPAGAVEDHVLTAHELDTLDGVLTGCTVAIAETGTLVLTGGPAEGRRALTLVPDLHVCLVRPEQVVETVPEAFEALRGAANRPLTFVSGPSATSDIELKRVEGVHGPRRLVVVILEEG
jgi:L-lactate dehydrogenase complex protein LldG